MDVTAIVTSIASITLFGYIVKSIVDIKVIKEKTRLSEKMLDKLSTGKDLNEFFKSHSGEEFFNNLRLASTGSKQKLISNLYQGIVVLFLGLGLLTTRLLVVREYHSDLSNNAFEAFGIVVLFIGIGMMIASLASFNLARKWGLMNGDTKPKIKS